MYGMSDTFGALGNTVPETGTGKQKAPARSGWRFLLCVLLGERKIT